MSADEQQRLNKLNAARSRQHIEETTTGSAYNPRDLNRLGSRLSAVAGSLRRDASAINSAQRALSQNQEKARQSQLRRMQRPAVENDDEIRTIQLKTIGSSVADLQYAIAFFLALAKDFSDFGFIGSLPGLGTIISLLVTIIIILNLFVANAFEGDTSTGFMARRMRRYILTLLVGLFEMLFFGLNFFPMTTVVVWWMYRSVRKHRKEMIEKQKQEVEAIMMA